MEGRLDALMLTVKKRSEPVQLNLLLFLNSDQWNCIRLEILALDYDLIFSLLTKKNAYLS